MSVRGLIVRVKKPTKPGPASDPQRAALYAMEREFLGACWNTKTSRKVLASAVTNACNTYQVARPRLKVIDQPQVHEFGSVTEDTVVLNRGYHGANLGTLLHELSHWIVWKYYPEDDREFHGPEFARVYMELLDKYRLLPRSAFKLLARQYGVKVAHHIRRRKDPR